MTTHVLCLHWAPTSGVFVIFVELTVFFFDSETRFFFEIHTVSVYTRGTSSLISTRRDESNKARTKLMTLTTDLGLSIRVFKFEHVDW